MKYAIIQTGSKQYRIKEGDEILVERLAGRPGESLRLSEVLLVADDGRVLVGRPHVVNSEIVATIKAHEKGEKIRVAKYRAKSRYRRVIGHRQQLTRIAIESIRFKSTSSGKRRKT